MKIKIKTKEIDFEFDDDKVYKVYYFFDKDNKELIDMLKECIQKVADETIKIRKKD
jgi:hypothetical protein